MVNIQKLQGACTKSEAPVQHLKQLLNTKHYASISMLGLLQMSHLVLPSIFGQSCMGFKQKPMAASALLSFFFLSFFFGTKLT